MAQNQKHDPDFLPVIYEGEKIGKQTTVVKGVEYTRFICDHGKGADGKRIRRTFSRLSAAKSHIKAWNQKAEKQAVLAKRIGEKADKLSTDDLLDAAKALDVLARCVPLEEAARFYMDHCRPDGPHKTVAELVEDYTQSRREAGRRPETVRELHNRLGCGHDTENCAGPKPASGFAADFRSMDCAHVTTTDLEKWIEKNARTLSERKKMRGHLVGLFNYGKKRKYLKDNPAEAIEKPTTKRSKPYVMPVDDVERLLWSAQTEADKLVPYLALCLFAGMRPAETQRLNWKDIDIQRGEIFVDADISKTHDERWIDIQDNLAAWLLPYRRRSGKVYFTTRSFNKARDKAGVQWANSCMRHSYGSYHLAMFDNAGKTALQMGHRDLGTLFQHYRRAVRKEDADKFWNIRPKRRGSDVIEPGKAV